MSPEIFSNISKIIERDSKSTTYKFALLRGVIEIIQDNSPYITFFENRVYIPTGLLVEKWLLYYYPLLQSKTLIPQINGTTDLAFATEFRKLIAYYESRGGLSAFYNDLKTKGIPEEIRADFTALARKIRATVVNMPMKYIGRSLSDEYYSIFEHKRQALARSQNLDLERMITDFGSFSIPADYYEAFKILGSFMSGQDSILFKWAEFSVNASGKHLSMERVLNEILDSPITERNIAESKKLYRDILSKNGTVYCVWTGRKINTYDIDHVIPFSVWKNNDLWNLLPSDSKINNQKRDKIPAPELIEKRKDLIVDYWQLIHETQTARFRKEIQLALLGQNTFSGWEQQAISRLQNSCDYLIEGRGFERWMV
ncbi:HNH endonuclease domain-containing protein [Flavobacterium sp.]|uniref:HNH endonuclease domain-containing protein n=1 Tax=Flavobacterium sp. TaxID=239 RepID=UPI00261F6E82|nr:HNH endonuclease domain-containing protein [Flavobacterium sp.]